MTENEMKKNEALKAISVEINKAWFQANACKLMAGDLEHKIIEKLQGNEAENELEEYARTLHEMLELIVDTTSGAAFDVDQLTD